MLSPALAFFYIFNGVIGLNTLGAAAAAAAAELRVDLLNGSTNKGEVGICCVGTGVVIVLRLRRSSRIRPHRKILSSHYLFLLPLRSDPDRQRGE